MSVCQLAPLLTVVATLAAGTVAAPMSGGFAAGGLAAGGLIGGLDTARSLHLGAADERRLLRDGPAVEVGPKLEEHDGRPTDDVGRVIGVNYFNGRQRDGILLDDCVSGRNRLCGRPPVRLWNLFL